VVSAAFEYSVASGEHGAEVVVAGSVQIATLTPAIGRPVGPNTTSSLRDPCAAAVTAHTAQSRIDPIALNIFIIMPHISANCVTQTAPNL
jgi:hypothetical protein